MDDISVGKDEMQFGYELPCALCGGNFEDSGSLSFEFLSRRAVPMHLQCVATFVSDQSVVCPHCHEESPTNINFGRFQHACCVNDVDTQQEIAAFALDHRPWRRLSASCAVASGCITTPRIAVGIIAPLHTGSSPVLTDLRMVVALDHLHLPTHLLGPHCAYMPKSASPSASSITIKKNRCCSTCVAYTQNTGLLSLLVVTSPSSFTFTCARDSG